MTDISTTGTEKVQSSLSFNMKRIKYTGCFLRILCVSSVSPWLHELYHTSYSEIQIPISEINTYLRLYVTC